jgi:hypothetical protein
MHVVQSEASKYLVVKYFITFTRIIFLLEYNLIDVYKPDVIG